jgi:hypothetical protein
VDVPLEGKRVYLLIQGIAPENASLIITNVIRHLCRRFHIKYIGLETISRKGAFMKKLIEIFKANYDFYADALERLSGSGNTQYQQQNKGKTYNCSKVIPFIPKGDSSKDNNVKKLIEAFKYGLNMYANSLYGDINWRYKGTDLPQNLKEQQITNKNRKKIVHLSKKR